LLGLFNEVEMVIRYRTLEAHYSGDSKLYTFLCPRLLVDSVKEGTIMVVKAANGLGIVRVSNVHATPQDKGNFQYRWAFQIVNVRDVEILEERAAEKQTAADGEGYDDFDDVIPFKEGGDPDDVAAVKAAVTPPPATTPVPPPKAEPKKASNPPPKVSIPSVPKL